jgi:hypothetical protein
MLQTMEVNWMGNGTLSINVPLMAGVLVGLFIFGFGYNGLVSWLERNGHDRGYTAFLVIGGSLVTLIGGSLVAGIAAGVWFTACFAASGLPMTIGSWARHAQARKVDQEKANELAREMLNGAETSDGICDEAGDHPSDQRQ